MNFDRLTAEIVSRKLAAVSELLLGNGPYRSEGPATHPPEPRDAEPPQRADSLRDPNVVSACLHRAIGAVLQPQR